MAMHVKHLVIGAGAVGLACAARLSKLGSTLLVEKNSRIGEETSSRNSEVIHGGIYYPNDSLKTKLCIEGKNMLYHLCSQKQIPHRRVGKWIFSTNKDESNYLGNLEVKCRSLGVPLRRLSTNEIHLGEPFLNAVDALESSTTGIIDSHAYMKYLEHLISESGSDCVFNSKLVQVTRAGGAGSRYRAHIRTGDGETETIEAESIVNAGGLHADVVARCILGESTPQEYRLFFLKGYYFSYSGKPLVSRLAYPIPDPSLKTLGTHATLDLAGRIKFGPDAHWTDRPDDYEIRSEDVSRLRDLFYETVRSYLPSIDRSRLVPDYCGIRPKLHGPESPQFKDFIIREESALGFPGVVNLVGIESPGLTSSLAIAKEVARLLGYSNSVREFDL